MCSSQLAANHPSFPGLSPRRIYYATAYVGCFLGVAFSGIPVRHAKTALLGVVVRRDHHLDGRSALSLLLDVDLVHYVIVTSVLWLSPRLRKLFSYSFRVIKQKTGLLDSKAPER
jgi:hypothetical protein